MKQIMIDLETLSTEPDANIVAIAAVDLDNLDNFFYRAVHDPTGYIDVDTVRWWLKQSNQAQEFISASSIALKNVMLNLGVWMAENKGYDKDLLVWGNGADFDNVILAQAFKRAGYKVPWSHKNNRCFRTLKNLFPQVPEPVFKGIKHNALDDVRHQARWFNDIMNYMTNKLNPMKLDD